MLAAAVPEVLPSGANRRSGAGLLPPAHPGRFLPAPRRSAGRPTAAPPSFPCCAAPCCPVHGKRAARALPPWKKRVHGISWRRGRHWKPSATRRVRTAWTLLPTSFATEPWSCSRSTERRPENSLKEYHCSGWHGSLPLPWPLPSSTTRQRFAVYGAPNWRHWRFPAPVPSSGPCPKPSGCC